MTIERMNEAEKQQMTSLYINEFNGTKKNGIHWMNDQT